MILLAVSNSEEKGDGTAWLDSRDQSRLADSMTPLLLASASPRRRALLADAGVTCEIVAAEVIELRASDAPNLDAAQLAEVNAGLKARAGWRPDRWVLGADTVVTLGGRVFGKPATLREARQFLRALSGRTHQVITACALLGSAGGDELLHETTRVTFRALTDDVIDRYLAAVPVLDKAGAYALQEQGELLIDGVEGSRTNVIGLPVERLAELFRARGLL
jgi:septum formation protein